MNKFVTICAAALVAGCAGSPLSFQQNEVDSVLDAGETHIAVLSAAHWDDMKAHLKPAFEIDGEKALEASLPRVSAFEEKILNAFAAKIGLGLPSSSETETRTTDLATGQVTGSNVVNITPGAAPPKEAGAEAAIAGATLPKAGLPAKSRENVVGQNDPLLHYQAANAVSQYVNVLNNLVENVPDYDDYDPYFVTLQITSFPYARHQPYDVYLDMSFFPQIRGGAAKTDIRDNLHTPIIIPVLVTDNLQGETTSRAAELITQLSAAAQGLVGGVFGSVGLAAKSQRSGSIVGTDLTATFTVGRTSENSLTAVLGAARNPYSEFAMIRRTHNVSVLVLVPKATSRSPQQFAAVDGVVERRIGLTMTTSLRRPDVVGEPLPPLHGKTAKGSVDRALERITELGLADELKGEDCSQKDVIRELIKLIPQSDFPGFVSKLKVRCEEFSFPEALYHVLADTYGTSPGFRSTTIVLPSWPPAKKS